MLWAHTVCTQRLTVSPHEYDYAATKMWHMQCITTCSINIIQGFHVVRLLLPLSLETVNPG